LTGTIDGLLEFINNLDDESSKIKMIKHILDEINIPFEFKDELIHTRVEGEPEFVFDYKRCTINMNSDKLLYNLEFKYFSPKIFFERIKELSILLRMNNTKNLFKQIGYIVAGPDFS